MERKWYDHKSVKCEGCAFFHTKEDDISRYNGNYGYERCSFYGYYLHPERFAELADDCEGFITPAEHAIKLNRERRNRKR